MSLSAYYPYIPIPLGFSHLRNRAKVNPLIINFHVVSEDELPHVIHLYRYRDIDRFRQDLDFILSHFTPVSMLEFLDSLNDGQNKLPEHATLLTFDDGFREIYDVVAPILLEKEVPATFFVTTHCIDNKSISYNNKQSLLIDGLKRRVPELVQRNISDLIRQNNIPGKSIGECIRRIPYKKSHLIDQAAELMGIDFTQFLEEKQPYLTSAQIAELVNNGFAFGGHGLDHARFSELTLEEQIEQARSSVEYLVDCFSVDYRIFAFPYSDIGVGNDFFRALEHQMDAFFGTHGLKEDPLPNHFQRINVETYDQSARSTIKYHYGRRIIYNLLGKQNMVR